VHRAIGRDDDFGALVVFAATGNDGKRGRITIQDQQIAWYPAGDAVRQHDLQPAAGAGGAPDHFHGVARRNLTDDLGSRSRRAAYVDRLVERGGDRKSTRLNSSHVKISYAVFCLKKKNRGSPTT